MAVRSYEHLRDQATLLFLLDDNATALQNNNIVFLPTPGATLIRTRLFLQFRVLQYPNTGATLVGTQWWQDLLPLYGVYVDDSVTIPDVGIDPIGGAGDPRWVIWGAGVGSLDGYQVDPDFPTLFDTTYKWDMPGGLSESFAKRKTTVGHSPVLYLNWNWKDRHAFINREPGSFPVDYDLSINYAIDTLWELPAS